MYVLLAQIVERLGTTDWGRIFVMAAATLGTLLNTFAVVLNNHLIAAVSATISIYLLMRIWFDGERRWRYFSESAWPPRSLPQTNCLLPRCSPSRG